MYEQVFNFNARPFTSTPYVKHYFGASAMNQAFGQAAICIQRGSGPVVAIGDIGTGKSLLLAKLAAEHQAGFQVCDIDSSSVNNRKDLLQNILFQLGKPFNLDSETELRFAVIETANPTEACPNGLLLLIDDAETLAAEIFEELRVLTNIVVDGSPQVRIVLAGRKSLEERLAEPAQASFGQRIASRVFLSNLSRDETAAYVIEHVNRVGGNGPTMFPAETTAKLHELTDGCPRLINQACDFVLILAATRGSTTISAELIEEAWNDVQSLPMGAGSFTAPQAATQTDQPSDWTLIEFGQLDDDTTEPSDATVYDFENAATATDSTVGYGSNEQPAQEATSELPADSWTAEQPSPQIDPELGVDLGSLQAMQDAAAAQQTPTEATAIQPQPAVNTSPAKNTADDSARLAMEQQLAAVFGTTMPATPAPEIAAQQAFDPVAAASSVAEPATQQPVDLTPTQDDQPSLVDSATDSNALMGIGSASTLAAGLVAGISQLRPSAPTVDADAQEPTLPTLYEAANQEQADTNLADPSARSNQASRIERLISAAADDNTQDVNATAPTPPAQDPFEESFAVETPIADDIANETIEQNQNALKLSSSDLSDLTPLPTPTPEPVVQPSEPQQPSASTDTPSIMPSGVSWLDSSPTAEENTNAQADDADAALPSDASNEASNEEPAEPISRGFSVLPMTQTEAPTVAEQNVAEQNNPATQQPQLAYPSEADTDIPIETEPTIDPKTESSSELRTHDNSEAVSDEISRQADEILARLNRQATPVEPEDQILSDIRHQQREITDSQFLGNTADQSIPLPAPTAHQDDSELLIVKPDVPTSEPEPDAEPEAETFPMTDSQISSGRAARMDYEQLFDRLRNDPDEHQQ